MCSIVATHPDGIAIDRLGEEITELAAHIHAATCRWLELVAEFDRRTGWSRGCRSCAEFLSWRCAIAPGAAREHVRVARRLEELPLIRAAFREGRLRYSKVRALTRVGNVEHEEGLLGLARHSTAAQLERMVRAYRGVVATEHAAAARPSRYVTWEHGDDGSLCLRACLPAEEGAIVLAALDAAVEQQRAESTRRREARVLTAAADVSAETRGAGGHPAGGPGEDVSAETHWAGGRSAGGPGEDVSAETRGAGRRAVVAACDDVSAETRGPGRLAAEAACVDVSAETHPSVEECVEAQPTLSERRADALVLMADTMLAGPAIGRNGGDRYQVVVHVDTATLSSSAAGDGRSELADGTPLAGETARRLACDAAIVPLVERDGRPLSVGRKTRTVPPALRRALASRDRGCRFPGCTSRCSVDAHHIEHWARGGLTSLDNLVQLCRFHHRLLHEGGFSVERAGPDFVFRRPDGRRLSPVPRPSRGHPAQLKEVNRRRGPIRADACVTDSYSPMDLGLCVDAMLRAAPAEAPGI
jgi:hypothetical protein